MHVAVTNPALVQSGIGGGDAHTEIQQPLPVSALSQLRSGLRGIYADEGIPADLFHAVAELVPDTLSDFDQRILEIFDGYVHGKITKRQFIERAGKYAAAGVTGAMILEQLAPNYALAQQVAPDDPAIETMRTSYDSPEGHGTIEGLMAMPAGAEGPLPAVLVVHENRGLNPYIEDVVRRVAKAGYLAFGPDGLTPLGGYPGTDEEGREMQRTLDGDKLMADFFAAFEFLRDHEMSTGKVGAVGFCYGGGVCNALAVAYPDLAASVPFYGRQPAADQGLSVVEVVVPVGARIAGRSAARIDTSARTASWEGRVKQLPIGRLKTDSPGGMTRKRWSGGAAAPGDAAAAIGITWMLLAISTQGDPHFLTPNPTTQIHGVPPGQLRADLEELAR